MPTQLIQKLAAEFMHEHGQDLRYEVDDQANSIFLVGSHRMEMRDVKRLIEAFLFKKREVPNALTYLDDVSEVVFERIRAQSP